jgi:hypothetical protein
VKYILVRGASCPEIGGLNIYIRCIVGYIDVGVASCPEIGRLNIYI